MSKLDIYGKGATISECGVYRYRLWRQWNVEGEKNGSDWLNDNYPYCVFIMLNPSTADANVDDPTIRRCINFATRFKYKRLEVVNLFAFRSPSPAVLKKHWSPVGVENDDFIRNVCDGAGSIICAWGTHGEYMDRDAKVLAIIDPFKSKTYALGLTKDGHPKHPLYLADDTEPEPFNR